MILAKNETALDYLGIHPNLDLALRKLTPEFLAQLGEERVELLPGQVWCTKFTYDTLPEEECFFEAHHDFLDIHLMLRGEERVALASPAALTEFEAQPEHDFYAYRGQETVSLTLSPGEFLVVFPDDAHKIKMQTLDGPQSVTKAVFKVQFHS